MVRTGILAAMGALLGISPQSQAFEVFQDPNNAGDNTAPQAAIPAAGCVDLNIWIAHGTSTPDPNTACSGSGGGDEQCGWDLHIVATDNAMLQSFVAEGPPADIVHSGSNLPGVELRANGGNPIFGELGAQRLGTLQACGSGLTGQVKLADSSSGNLWVTAALTTAAVPAVTLAVIQGPTNDFDGDGVTDDIDNCVFVANPLQEDRGGKANDPPDGIGDACQCGDVTGDGKFNSQDSTMIKRNALELFAPLFNVPGNCDVTGDGNCNAQDATMITRKALDLFAPLFVTQDCPNFTNGPPNGACAIADVDANGNCVP